MAHLNRKIGIPSFDMTGKTAIITGGDRKSTRLNSSHVR